MSLLVCVISGADVPQKCGLQKLVEKSRFVEKAKFFRRSYFNKLQFQIKKYKILGDRHFKYWAYYKGSSCLTIPMPSNGIQVNPRRRCLIFFHKHTGQPIEDVPVYTNQVQKLKELVNLNSLCNFQLFVIQNKGTSSNKNINEPIYSLQSLGFFKENFFGKGC